MPVYFENSWSATMLKDVVEAYRAGPEFIVRHSLWPEFRLRLRRSEAVCARGYAQDVISGIAQGCGTAPGMAERRSASPSGVLAIRAAV